MKPSPCSATDSIREAMLLERKKMESLLVMAGGVAHDYSNHLTCILGNNQIVLRDLPADSPLREHAERIQSSGQLAIELTQDIMTYTGRIRLCLRDTELVALIRAMLPELQQVAGKKMLIKNQLPDSLPAVKADADRIRQMLCRLVANAADALVDRTGTVSLSAEPAEGSREPPEGWIGERLKAGRYVALVVADSGHGMTPDVMARIFDPFYSTRLRAHGMGLPVVLGIVRAHHGAISVQSAPDKGSSFRVLLPCPPERC